jgi:type VI protein secretion system component Hcp
MTSYMWIQGVTSADAATPGTDWILVDRYAFGMQREELVVGFGEDSETQKKPLIRLATVNKAADSHTAKLAQWHVDHRERRYKKVVIAECDMGFEPYMLVTLENALLVGYSLTANADIGGGGSNEQLSIEYTKLEFKFRTMDSASAFDSYRTFKFDDAQS